MDDQPRQERKRKIFSLNNKLFSIFIGLVIAGLLCAGVYVFAIGGPPGSQWDPGETLNPGCTPGSGNCSTVPPAVYSFGSNNFTGTGTFTGGYESSFGNSAANRFQISTVTLGGGYGTYPLLRFDSSDQPLYSAVGNIGFISDYLIVYHENTAPSLGFSSPDLAVVSTFSLNETTGELNYSPLLGGTSPGINIAGGILAKGVIGDIRKLTFEHHDNSGFWGVTFTGNYIKSVLDDPTPLSMDTTFHFGGYTAGASADWLTLTGTTANFQGLNLTTTGTINTGRIYFTAANWSTALGYQALQANTTGNQNTAVGHQALWSNTTGQENTAVGMQALRANTIGRFNTAIGPYTLINNIDGDHNTAVGVTALYSNTSGDYNVAVGNNALNDNTTASFNTAMGYSALNSNTTGSHNTATGYRALFSNTTGADNTAIGRTALNDNNTGSNNTAISFSALSSNTTGNGNTAVGVNALQANTTADSNTAVGANALQSNTTAAGNTAVGYIALQQNITGADNTAVGYGALYYNTTGSLNAAFGEYALERNTTGNWNTAFGASALRFTDTGIENLAFGGSALYNNTSGNDNVAIGDASLSDVVTGNYNTALGNGAGLHTTGSNGLFLGNHAGANGTGSNNVAIGYYAGANEAGSDTLYIDDRDRGNSAAEKAGALLYGTFSGTPSLQTLTVNGNLTVTNYIKFDNTNYNTKIGYQTGSNFPVTTAAQYNTFLGYQAGLGGAVTADADYNTAIGYQAFYSNTEGSTNTAIGVASLYSNTEGYANTANGDRALYSNTTGFLNTAIGVSALTTNTTGDSNTAIGVSALFENTIGTGNTAIGVSALTANTEGLGNTAIGVSALISNTKGRSNVAIGDSALYSNNGSGGLFTYFDYDGSNNTAIGDYALYSNTIGAQNSAQGSNSLYSNTIGNFNSAQGSRSLYSNTEGQYNTANGYQALYSNTIGNYNTAIGLYALVSNTEGSDNIAVGDSALPRNTTGSNNVALGYNAGLFDILGSNNVFLGPFAGAYETGSNAFYVDNQDRTDTAGDKAKALLYGTFAADAVDQFLKVNGGLIVLNSAAAPTSPTNGELYYDTDDDNLYLYQASAWQTITTSSSLRYKHDIQPLTEDWSKILQVQPILFIYNNQPDNKTHIGYIAEDFEALGLTDLLQYDGQGRPSGINYDRISLYNTEILKQQQIEINALKQHLGLPTENTAINPAGTLGSGEVSGVNLSSIDQSVKSSLANLGATLVNGVISLKQVITENLTAKTARIEKMEMVASNGDIYCTWIDDNGDWQKVKGDCASISSNNLIETTAPTEIMPVQTTPTDQDSQQAQQAAQQAQQTAEQAQQTATDAQQTAQQVQQQVQQQPQALDVISVANISDINVDYGTSLASVNLPSNVDVTLSDNSTKNVKITWNNGMPTYDPNASGTYVFSGVLMFSGNVTNTNNFYASVNVILAQQTVPVENPVSMTGDLIRDAVSNLFNGVGKFVSWLVSSGTSALSSFSIGQKLGTSLIEAPVILQSFVPSSLEIKSLTKGFFEPIITWLKR